MGNIPHECLFNDVQFSKTPASLRPTWRLHIPQGLNESHHACPFISMTQLVSSSSFLLLTPSFYFSDSNFSPTFELLRAPKFSKGHSEMYHILSQKFSLTKGLANHGSGPVVFINKDLWKHGCTSSSMCCLWPVFFVSMAELRSCHPDHMTHKASKTFTIWCLLHSLTLALVNEAVNISFASLPLLNLCFTYLQLEDRDLKSKIFLCPFKPIHCLVLC